MAEEPNARECRKCGRELPLTSFARDRNRRDGLQVRCRECVARYNSAAHSRRRREPLGKRVPIASQGGVCCVCLSAVPAHVDHCHETGRVRGVLCFSCNAALGQFKDQPDVMRRAAAYVEGNAWKPTLVAPGVYQLPS
ncbi:endonuclease domain-containing protein [Streptomyces eurythermus]|uniref:endonuclease domain-containing protein n=1 Tax=Streptomyces eurythermus TaxID=42237 RepID=UPI0033C1855B